MEVRLPNKLDQSPRLHTALTRFLGTLPVSPRARLAFELSLEELFANLVHHAFPGAEEHEILFRFSIEGPELSIEVTDDGQPFDLTLHAPPDLSQPLDQRPIGGLGVHMIRQSMDRVSYRRSGKKNIVTIVRRWAD